MSSDPAIDCFGQAGYTGLPQFEKKDALVRELCHFFVIDKHPSALEQFKEGLMVLKVIELIKNHPNMLRGCFCYTPQTLTAEILDGIFKACYSEEGCRMREREEMIVMHWRDYLQECHGELFA